MAENTLSNNLKERFAKLNNVQKILIIGIPSILIIGIIILFITATPKPMEILYTGLEQQESAKIVEYLKNNKIDYQLLDNGSTIQVEKNKVVETRLDLAKEGIPSTGILGYEIFDRTNLGMSEFVQKLNYKRALEGELSKTINSIDEVKSSRVHIVIPDRALFEKDQKKPTASVTVHLKSGKNISNRSITGIQTLVAKSIEGMLPEDVSVIDHKGKLLSEIPVDPNSVAGLTAQQLEQQKKLEDYLTQKVQSLLDNVIGRDNSSIRINTELDFTKIEQTKTDYDPERQVIRSEQQILESNKSTDSLSYPAVSMDKNESNTIQNYEISQTFEKIVHSVGNIKKLSIAAIINGTTKIVDSANQKKLVYIPRTDEEIRQLTEIIKNAVGFDEKRNDQISVINVPFDTMIDSDITEQLKEKPWYLVPENQKLLLLIAAILISIFIMYRLLQSNPVKERVRIAMELPQKIDIKDEEEEPEEETELEDLDIDQSDLLLMPSELPEQLLLEGDSESKGMESEINMLEEAPLDQRTLAERARAKLEETETPELTEEALLKLEMKNKVEEFMDENTESAVKLLKMFMSGEKE